MSQSASDEDAAGCAVAAGESGPRVCESASGEPGAPAFGGTGAGGCGSADGHT
ncbi:hypothetical protein ACFUIY_14450 [Streptomyces griseorubiginosus]|uniref:hypothetical protein n=1 Tax=Streptomyces griseorubiginosus TaxID=67304 RepID=UPI0015E83B70|nr:hypothetical protein [Streptomyces griseorubiginosus]